MQKVRSSQRHVGEEEQEVSFLQCCLLASVPVHPPLPLVDLAPLLVKFIMYYGYSYLVLLCTPGATH
jgi:hypothetical protein